MRHANRLLIGVMCIALTICSCKKNDTDHPAPTQGNQNRPAEASEPLPVDRGGKYEVRGEKKEAESFFSVKNSKSSNHGDQFTIEINWPVTKSQFDDLKEGQSTFKVRHVLELDKLDLEPYGPKTRFRLICKNGSATVTLDFAGSDPELKSKSESGLK